MSPLLYLLPAQSSAPAHAARETTLQALDALPRRRRVTVGLLAWAARPGLTVTPWTLRGVLDALEVLELELESVALLGDPGVARSVLDRVARDQAAGAGWHDEERRLGLSMPGVPGRARIPSAWVGTSLCLVAPLAHRPLHPDTDPRSWLGPVQSALATLAGACGVERAGEAGAAAGARLVQEVFAGCCLVVDATWWSALHPSGDYAAHPVAPEHCLASADAADEAAAACIDDWVDQQLGLPRHLSMQRRTTPQIRGRRRSWPRARLPRPSATGLSTVRIQPLWRGGPDRARASGQVSVLRVPGSFGTTWHSYEPRSP